MQRMESPEQSDVTLTYSWRLWAGIFVGWTLIGLIYTLNYHYFADHYVAIFTKQPGLREMAIWELPYWLLWAALTPLIVWLTARFPLARGRRLRQLSLHVAACLALTLAHRASYLLTCWLLKVAVFRQRQTFVSAFDYFFFFNLSTGFTCYALILMASFAFFYSSYQRKSLTISRLEAELAQLHEQSTRERLQALQMRLQPHFLFNTLQSISALLDEDVEAADEMIARLGDFLQLTLESSSALVVTLEEELKFLDRYVRIESVRLKDRLDVRWEIGPETLAARVPNLILQPLVENAIRHGIAARPAPGRVEIRATRADGLLRLQVTDDGPGLGGDTPANPARQGGHGVALTRERLESLYATRQRLTLAAAPGGGLAVTLEIPFDTAGSTAAETESRHTR
jgi:two-component system, LytTR family, sensor kinase